MSLFELFDGIWRTLLGIPDVCFVATSHYAILTRGGNDSIIGLLDFLRGPRGFDVGWSGQFERKSLTIWHDSSPGRVILFRMRQSPTTQKGAGKRFLRTEPRREHCFRESTW